MMKSLLSVIIPVYNVEQYLSECLESVCRQTYRHLEIILIDDGSLDHSGQICDMWANRDDRILVIHKENGGVSTARNEGLLASSGDFIGFVDSDDWIKPDMYEKLMMAISDADMACCGYVDYPLGTTDTPAPKGTKTCTASNSAEAAWHLYEKDGYFTAIWNKVYRREALIKDGAFIQMDPKLSWGEDEVWLAQVLKNCSRVSFVPEALYHWRPTQHSATRNQCITDRQMTLFEAKKRAMKLLPQDTGLQNLVKARLYNDCFSMKVTAYATQDWKKYRKIDRILSGIKPVWMRSSDSSPIRKLKVLLMDAGMMLHLPGKWVQRIDNVRRYGIKR